ncbi:centromere protein Cenp-K [Halteromyces radiatus]|uniref:centromere protein Cenp-K n=1 Tax=Halteromyces radiatus TaxID=101107 RepID=UPI00221FB538|nr:centromere protein Cenp-K [Halteromyces radiatus]KAI8082935.1 centromere protein Cenp-K [Halteromyces radiatus]
MNLEEHLENLVLKAAKDFDQIAGKEPTVTDDNNASLPNTLLDKVLTEQKEERDRLWKELHELEEQENDANEGYTFDEEELPQDRKQLAIYMYEEQELLRELAKQEQHVNMVNFESGKVIPELRFRQRLMTSIKEMKQLLTFLREQVTEAKALYQQEDRGLEESQQLQDALTAKLTEIETFGAPTLSMNVREKVMKARTQYQATMENLVDFLDEYYPPHLIDSAHLTEDNNPQNLCELKFILEDLMNRAVLSPSNPYIELEDGTYWSPYIETLVKGGIAERDPSNFRRLRLVDFRIY